MSIYEDRVYQPPDMIEKLGGFRIRRVCARPGRPVTESAAEPDDPEFGDAAHCRAALHRPVVGPAKESAENAVEASQIVEAAKVAKTPGADPEQKQLNNRFPESNKKHKLSWLFS